MNAIPLRKPLAELGARCTFILPDTGSRFNSAIPHLQVCLTDPCSNGDILCVSIGSFHKGMDETCLVKVRDHPYIKWISTVYYGTPRKLDHKKTLARVNSGECEWKGVADERLFMRICAGMLTSDFAVPAFQGYAKQQWKIMGLKVSS